MRRKKKAEIAAIAMLLMILLVVMLVPEQISFAVNKTKAGTGKKTKAQATESISASAFARQMQIGWNLGNSLDAHYGDPTGDANLSQETIWGNPKVDQKLIDYVAAQGFDVIRIPVSWYYHSYRDKKGVLHISSQWLARVQEVVDYAYHDHLYVILDSHHDQKIIYAGVSEEKMVSVYADAQSMWTDIAKAFSSYDDHLILESYNEVDNLEKSWNYGDLAAQQMNKLNQIFVNTVRKAGGYNAERILMVPTLLDGSSIQFQTSFILPKDIVSDRLLVTVHNYDKAYDEKMEYLFQSLEQFSTAIGAPVIIGEFGTSNGYNPAEYRTVHASNYVSRAAAHGIKCIWWDNGSDYAIINRKNLQDSDSDMIKAMTKSGKK